MKKIGIVGGLGPQSTIDYYKGIIFAFHSTYNETGYPEIAIESCNLKEMLDYSNNNNWDKIAEILANKFNWLKQAGCDFGAIASNTPHKVFDKIQRLTDLYLISIIESACSYALDNHYKKLCLLGTGFTMKSDFYQQVFSKQGIDLVVPGQQEIEYFHDKIYSELEFGLVKEKTKERFISILNHVVEEHQCDGAIMGCTELPLIIKEDDIDVAYLDTTKIHIEKIIEMCK